MNKHLDKQNSAGNSAQKRRGRPASVSAASHGQILDAVQAILTEKSVRELTIEEVAQRAGVGKPTIYKWWPSKTALVLALFQERMIPSLAVPENLTPEEKIRTQALELIALLNGFFGKVARELIGEGQSDRNALKHYRELYLRERRACTAAWIEQAKASGEMKRDTDPEVVVDMIYGPIYYRLLLNHQPLDAAFGNKIVDGVLKIVRSP